MARARLSSGIEPLVGESFLVIERPINGKNLPRYFAYCPVSQKVIARIT